MSEQLQPAGKQRVSSPSGAGHTTFVDIARSLARRRPHDDAFIFLLGESQVAEAVSYEVLDRRARARRGAP